MTTPDPTVPPVPLTPEQLAQARSQLDKLQAQPATPPPPAVPSEPVPMLPPSEGGKLLALGQPITLADGRSVRLRYGMAGLVALEEAFGSVQGITDAFGGVVTGAAGKVFAPLVKMLAAGLTHEGITYEQIITGDLLDVARLREYGEAAGLAFREAFPSAAPGGDVPAAETPTAGSPGPTGSTSAP